MKKSVKTILAILGAIDVVFTMFSPLLLFWVWIELFGFSGIFSYLLFGIAAVSCFYRAIKIGFLKSRN